MIKYLFTCLLLFTGLAAISQPKKSVVQLISSQRSMGIKLNGVDVIKVYQGVFKQDYSTLRSDSAYFYRESNAFDAFGNVNINQGDTLNIYSDKLNYNGNTHVALLTDHVRMVDKDATLTTNYLTYNTATRIGTYTGGGKLVNKDNTLTSTNGYYFAFTRDAYFRYNVVLNTIDAIIKTDTLRYNTGSRISYFYGPTHIYGKKHKDTLYTENGTYNTQTEQAFFGKKNLYTQDTKSLKGDSLFYDRLKGYGTAIRNVVFNDNEQKITLHGQLGTYYEKGEKAIVTKNPWVTIITEEKDTTKTDSAKLKPDSAKGKTLATIKSLKTAPPVLKPAPNTKPVVTGKNKKGDAVKTATTRLPAISDTGRVKQDTIYMVADTLETRMMPYKEYKVMQEQHRLSLMRDTSAKARQAAAAAKVSSKFLTAQRAGIPKDTSLFHRDFFGAPKKKTAPVQKQVAKSNAKKAPADTLHRKIPVDSVNLHHTYKLQDTTRIRILIGHFNAKIFKSDLQAKADSLFYSTTDSTIRCYGKPMLWAQNSQMSGDTIYLQMKNKKLDNMDIFPSAFIVNVEKGDTTHFNQVGGKKMKGFFVNDKLNRMFVDGNAEDIYFQRDSTGKVTNMERSLSGRIRVNFKDNQALNILNIAKPEHRVGPPEKFTEDERILKGFIWKPKDRPISKEAIIPDLDKTHKYHKPPARSVPNKGKAAAKKGSETSKKTTAKGSGTVVPAAKPADHKPAAKDSVTKKLPADTISKGKPDTTAKKKP